MLKLSWTLLIFCLANEKRPRWNDVYSVEKTLSSSYWPLTVDDGCFMCTSWKWTCNISIVDMSWWHWGQMKPSRTSPTVGSILFFANVLLLLLIEANISLLLNYQRHLHQETKDEGKRFCDEKSMEKCLRVFWPSFEKIDVDEFYFFESNQWNLTSYLVYFSFSH